MLFLIILDEIFYGYDRFVKSKQIVNRDCNAEDKIKILYYGGGLHNKDLISRLVHNSKSINE